NGRGVSYNELGNYNRAIEDLNKAIRLDINFAKAYNNRGFSYDKLGNYKKAIENYKEAIRLDPNYATAKQNLESILRRR
ncbi:tetratricopeptide repeat protein, partial [Crocosphaera watsonii]